MFSRMPTSSHLLNYSMAQMQSLPEGISRGGISHPYQKGDDKSSMVVESLGKRNMSNDSSKPMSEAILSRRSEAVNKLEHDKSVFSLKLNQLRARLRNVD